MYVWFCICLPCHKLPCARFATLHHCLICITPLVNQALKQHRLCSANKQSNSFLVNPASISQRLLRVGLLVLSVLGKTHSVAADRRDYPILSHTEKDIFSICNRHQLLVMLCVFTVHVLVHETAAGTPHRQRLQRQSGRPAGIWHHQWTGMRVCASMSLI